MGGISTRHFDLIAPHKSVHKCQHAKAFDISITPCSCCTLTASHTLCLPVAKRQVRMLDFSKWDRFDVDAAEKEVERQVGCSVVEAFTKSLWIKRNSHRSIFPIFLFSTYTDVQRVPEDAWRYEPNKSTPSLGSMLDISWYYLCLCPELHRLE